MILDILTVLLVIITGFYAWVTYQILKSNEKVVEVMNSQAEAMTRPYITITPFIEVEVPAFYLRIKNTGKTAAKGVQLEIDKGFSCFGVGSTKFSDFAVFNTEIDSFSPGQELVFMLDSAPAIFHEDANQSANPQQFSIEATYSYGEVKVAETSEIDLRPYLYADIPSDIHAKRLGDIQKEISKLTDVIKGMGNK